MECNEDDEVLRQFHNLDIASGPKENTEAILHSTKTGLIYDESMVKHECLWDPLYPESPERFKSVLSRIKELGLHDRCEVLKPRKATEEEILMVHTKKHFDNMSSSSGVTQTETLKKLSSNYDCVYFHPETFELALLAAGSVTELVDRVVSGKLRNGFALVRPPGHHAMREEACGFCFFNNVAIGAAYAVNKLNLKRVLVVDFDVHHGQGTQYAFYDDPRVLYFSSHRYDEGLFWPELIESNYNFVGTNNAKGFNINVPLNEEGLHNGDFLAIWTNILLPVVYEYNPELILISAGYDAAIGCPEGEMEITPAMYAHLCHMLMTFANGKVCAVLEGGYCLSSLSESAALTLRTLLGDPCPRLEIPYPLHKAVVNTVLDVIWALRPFWQNLAIQGKFQRHSKTDEEDEMERRRHFPVVGYKGKILLTPKPVEYVTEGVHRPQAPEDIARCESLLQHLKLSTDLSVPIHRTGLVYHKEMTQHSNMYYKKFHPERPERIQAIFKRLESSGLIGKCFPLSKHRYATEEELSLAHDQKYIEKIRNTVAMDDDALKKITEDYTDIYFTPHTYENARLAVGSLLQVVDSVLSCECQNGFAIIRPPGHHANKDTAAGFCVFNNVAIAAKYALKNPIVKRVVVVDWDVHHGDGTQALLKDDDRVLFVSLHRYDHCTFYPTSTESNFNIQRNVINVPWSGGAMSDYDYILAFSNLILPVIYEFNPDLVLVSSGFDAAEGDPLGHYNLSPAVYGHMTHLLSSLANGKVVVALEGGYNLNSISSCAVQVLRVLLGYAPRMLSTFQINESSKDVIRKSIAYHETYWSCLAFNADLPDDEVQF